MKEYLYKDQVVVMDKKTDKLLLDQYGEPLVFKSQEDAKKYIEDNLILVPVNYTIESLN